MPNTPSSSFIPKQGTAKRSRNVSRQIHLFTVLSYILFFGSLTASVGVFLYEKHIDKQLKDEVVALDAAIANFSNEKMEQVKTFNARLIQAQERISNSVSAVALFDSLEAATAVSVGLQALELERIGDEQFTLTAEINTGTFDSALFQRGLYERSPIIESVLFEDISLGTKDQEEGIAPSGVSFKAKLGIPLTAVPFSASVASPISIPVPAATSTEIDTTDDTLEANETTI